ncbi:MULTISPECIES: hypothetical protein [unclassified Pseudonocardia]|uniref:hypothetical protein n=1 Tax=unclassified Pseudonocardia TaxID=2619320 RepID=UPI00096336F4|nr:hypothetical protein [Pseudonocardia sp. Ae707_Ps1]OLM08961.1 hypothetical protein Ae707Ps1_5908 [Pseudonocardia sp. Ae707_Ps1]
MFPHLMKHPSIARPSPGRPWTRPERSRSDKAYSSRLIHRHLRERRIVAVIPDPPASKDTVPGAALAVVAKSNSGAGSRLATTVTMGQYRLGAVV